MVPVDKVVHHRDGRDYRRYLLIIYSSMVLLMLYGNIAPSNIIFYGWLFQGVLDTQSWGLTKLLLPVLFTLHVFDLAPRLLKEKSKHHREAQVKAGRYVDVEEEIHREQQEEQYQHHDDRDIRFFGDRAEYDARDKYAQTYSRLGALGDRATQSLYEYGFSLGLGLVAIIWLFSASHLPATDADAAQTFSGIPELTEDVKAGDDEVKEATSKPNSDDQQQTAATPSQSQIR